MKLFVAGSGHLAHYTIVGAASRKLHVTERETDADLFLLARDTPTDEKGNRELSHIERDVANYRAYGKPMLLMSQVPPGFCRRQECDMLYYYPETLRIKDAFPRACAPEYIMVGFRSGIIPGPISQYVVAFGCPWSYVPYETAEFAKIAVNMALAAQVDYANRMHAACEKIGADWGAITHMLFLDKRIGPHAYLQPGRWQDSLHLLRDYVTLREIEQGDARAQFEQENREAAEWFREHGSEVEV